MQLQPIGKLLSYLKNSIDKFSRENDWYEPNKLRHLAIKGTLAQCHNYGMKAVAIRMFAQSSQAS